MAQGEWLQPQYPVDADGISRGRQSEAQWQLRPLSLGEVLDRTFALYRSQFWLFAGISMLAATLNVVAQAISLAMVHKMVSHAPVGPVSNPMQAMLNFRELGPATVASYGVGLLYLLVSAITHAATAYAMTEVYLRRPVTVREALAKVLPRWSRWIGIAVWQYFSFFWIPGLALLVSVLLLALVASRGGTGLSVIAGVLLFLAVFGGFPVGVMLYLRNALAVPAAITEGLTIRPAMRRSKALAVGTKGRLFVVLLIAFCLLMVVGVLESPVSFLVMMSPNKEHYLARGLGLVLTFVGNTVVAPVAMIGVTLVYFDQRVRREALDLELLLEGARDQQTGESPTPALETYAPQP